MRGLSTAPVEKTKSMQVVEITGPRQVRLTEQPDPEPLGDLVAVKVTVAPMCTEYKAYQGGWASSCLGHEAAGEVAAVAQPGRVRVGDRVVVMPSYPCGLCPLCLAGDYIYCQAGLDVARLTGSAVGTATYAQHLLKPDWMLVPIPDDLSTEHAALACCGLGPTFGAMERLAVTAFDTVLIAGLGPVGLGGVLNGVLRGARVLALESHPYRAALARELGAAAVIDPRDPDAVAQVLALTSGVGPDKAIDCSGSPAGQRLLIEAVRRRGQVAFVGEGGELPLHVSDDMLRKGLTLHGCWHYNRADTPRVMQAVRKAGPLLDKFITHSFAMSQVQEAFELQLTGECGKVLLRPWQ